MHPLDLIWDHRYPPQAILRQEIAAITDTFVTVLFTVLPRDAVAGIYAKGSARKPWDSPVDYVPELSDVDFHVLFSHDGEAERPDSIETAMIMSRSLENEYRQRVPSPVHVPRLQVINANELHREPDFIYSAPNTVETLYGLPYPAPELNSAKSQAAARANLLSHDMFLRQLPSTMHDKYGKHLWEALRPMNWRIGPTGPRVLELRGTPYLHAWGINRTAIIALLREIGEEDLADDYAAYYLAGWRYFLSGRLDGEAARNAILAGWRVLSRGIAVAHERV